MKRIGAALTTVCATALAGPSLAEGWMVMDLGETATREICMERADRVLNAYLEANGGHSVEQDSWTKYGYDLQPGDNDVLIMCPVVSGDVYNAFLVVYGAFTDGEEDHTGVVAEELQHLWDAETETPDGAGGGTGSVARALADLDRALGALDEAQTAVAAAREALQAAASGEDEGEGVIDLDAPTNGAEEDWIDLDEILQPLKQDLREGVAPEAPGEEPAGEAAPAPEDEPALPAEEAPDDEDISPVDPR